MEVFSFLSSFLPFLSFFLLSMDSAPQRLFNLLLRLEPLLVEWHTSLDSLLNLLFALVSTNKQTNNFLLALSHLFLFQENQQSQIEDSRIMAAISDPVELAGLAVAAFEGLFFENLSWNILHC